MMKDWMVIILFLLALAAICLCQLVIDPIYGHAAATEQF